MMERVWLIFLILLGLNEGTAQTVRQQIEQRFTEFKHDRRSYMQNLQFPEGLSQDYFTYQVLEGSEYAKFNVRLLEITGIDIGQIGADTVLLFSFREPLTVHIYDESEYKEIRQEMRQMLPLPIRYLREGMYLRHLFGELHPRLNYLLNGQIKNPLLHEMVSLPPELSRPYKMGKYPVTVEQYRAYCLAKRKPMPPPPPWGWQSDHPMVNITWQEAKDYCAWLSQKTGLLYDLPSKDRWQYVVLDERENLLDEIAWWGENANSSTQKVGLKNPNAFGAYDMQGNVWEWLDAEDTNAEAMAAGGSWDSHFEQCQWNSTTTLDKSSREFDVGFRVVMTR